MRTWRFRRSGDGRVHVRLPATEHAFLASLLPQLQSVVNGEQGVAHLRDRLFPPAYYEPADEQAFQRLVGDDLVDQRRGAIADVVTSLETGRPQGRKWYCELDADLAQAWLAVLHDLRLVLAQVVGIRTEDDWNRDPATAQPAEVALWHLGALQEELIDVLMHDLDGAD